VSVLVGVEPVVLVVVGMAVVAMTPPRRRPYWRPAVGAAAAAVAAVAAVAAGAAEGGRVVATAQKHWWE
jgi:hypothetical protein